MNKFTYLRDRLALVKLFSRLVWHGADLEEFMDALALVFPFAVHLKWYAIQYIQASSVKEEYQNGVITITIIQ